MRAHSCKNLGTPIRVRHPGHARVAHADRSEPWSQSSARSRGIDTAAPSTSVERAA